MSRMLSLVSHLLQAAQSRAILGRTLEARKLLDRLLTFPDLSAADLGAARKLYGDLALRAGRPRAARRHLEAAVALLPDDGELRLLLAKALAQLPKVRADRTWAQFRAALKALPTSVDALLAAGEFAAVHEQDALALRLFRRALREAPNSVAVLTTVGDMLAQMDRAAAAQRLLLTARFRNPRSTQIAGLYQSFQFEQARREQVRSRQSRTQATEAPIVLKFPQPQSAAPQETTPVVGGVIRRDLRSGRRSHLPRIRAFRPDSRQAP